MKEERKHMSEIIAEINDIYNIDDESEVITDALIEIAGNYHGKYHFWIDLDGFVEGDATHQEIEIDLKESKKKDLAEFLCYIDDMFIQEYRMLCKEHFESSKNQA